jgi:hypothetical protein
VRFEDRGVISLGKIIDYGLKVNGVFVAGEEPKGKISVGHGFKALIR